LETGRVAVDCGADAVYIGGPGFGARRAAGNSLTDVAALVACARPFGVRVYATLNTLLFDDELAGAEAVARGLIDAGVDALIVQDMAFLRLGLGRSVELHASNQTSNIEPATVAFLGRVGFRRVILERALSLDDIRAIRAASPDDLELEAFIHGALCVGHSGRCFMSRASGDGSRSGNRGDCSQPCRMPWDLVDSAGRAVIRGKHLLSLRDLDLSARVGQLMDAGVTSFKIEGRLKDAGYVRNIVSHYRAVIDRELSLRPALRRASVGRSVPDFLPDPVKSFTRGTTEYFFDSVARGAKQPAACSHEVGGDRPIGTPLRMASFDTPKAIGESIGRVDRIDCERTGNWFFTLHTAVGRGLSAGDGGNTRGGLLSAGDGICFFAGGELRGTNINRVEGARVYPNDIEAIAPGTEVFRNHDHVFARALERSRMRRRIAVTATVTADRSKISVTFTDETGLSAMATREGTFEPAKEPAKMAATIREQLSKSGDTIFEVISTELSEAQNKTTVGVPTFIPVSMLAQMRREGLEKLFEARAKLQPVRNTSTEDPTARAPLTQLSPEDNVTNRLAERFWRDHGVGDIAPAMEMHGPAAGDTVMRSRYCIRREIGECLREGTHRDSREGSQPGSELFLERGASRWRLVFDCVKCEMRILKT
jgi:putative protease